MTFNEANQQVHKVEDEWHYPILTKYGFKPITKTGIGFVRAYNYERGDGEQIQVNTRVSCDYWSVVKGTPNTQEKFYLGNLEPHLKTLCLPSIHLTCP